MSERILVCTAWPYANGSLHLGHIAGAYLPADIFARYHRMKGNEVLMVSGSDEHGTPITLRAEKEGKTPGEIADRYHNEFLDCWKRLGISYDLFTRTTTSNHTQVTHDLFLTLLEKGKIGEIYHIAGSQELSNIELGKMILRILSKPEDAIEFIDDLNIRPGHDRRYALSSEKIRALGWQPKYNLERGIENAVLWYKENGWWFI